MALVINARCMEALDHVICKRLPTPEEEKEWISSLNFGSEAMMGGMGISWLRDGNSNVVENSMEQHKKQAAAIEQLSTQQLPEIAASLPATNNGNKKEKKMRKVPHSPLLLVHHQSCDGCVTTLRATHVQYGYYYFII